MPDPRDIVEIESIAARGAGEVAREGPARRPWLGVFFRCCLVYARVYRNEGATEYVGRCPRCRAEVRALVGEGGTSKRIFEAE